MIVVVVGTGRCGSSAVTKMVIDEGVFMGERFQDADDLNPGGYWEDLDFVAVTKHREVDWQAFSALADVRRKTHEAWGFKAVMKTYAAGDTLAGILSHLPDARVIWCRRPLGEVADSYIRCWYQSSPREDILGRVTDMEAGIAKALAGKDYLTVWCKDIDGSAGARIKDFLQ